MELDEEYIQIKTLSDKVSETIFNAYRNRFTTFDSYEKSVIFMSLTNVLMSFIMRLSAEDRVFAVRSLLTMVDRILSSEG